MLIWQLEHIEIDGIRFKYRIRIKDDEKDILTLLTNDKWPGESGALYCLRQNSEYIEDDYLIKKIEEVPIKSFKNYGKRISIVLDRPRNKRCDFLFLKKKYKNKEGEYEQIFWRSPTGIIKKGYKKHLYKSIRYPLNIIIDKQEKYPWKFPKCNIEEQILSIGDYALKNRNGQIIAIIERKTFSNMLKEISNLSLFHQKLDELETVKNAVLLIEADYSHFLKEKKLKKLTPLYVANAIAEIFALHPTLQIVFAGNKKLANEWAYRYFLFIYRKDLEYEKGNNNIVF